MVRLGKLHEGRPWFIPCPNRLGKMTHERLHMSMSGWLSIRRGIRTFEEGVFARDPLHHWASHVGMPAGGLNSVSTQIAVRLPDEMVAFLDRSVATGRTPSRAALVASAVEREMRRMAAEQDSEILQAHGAADDLDALVKWTGTHAMIED